MNILEKFNKKQVENLSQNDKGIDAVNIGDTVIVDYRITEGTTTRIQKFEGVVIAKSRSNSNYSSSFTVRKISYGVGVERKFMIHSPLFEKVTIVSKGVVRRSKLYYLRNLTGKAARVKKQINRKDKEAK